MFRCTAKPPWPFSVDERIADDCIEWCCATYSSVSWLTRIACRKYVHVSILHAQDSHRHFDSGSLVICDMMSSIHARQCASSKDQSSCCFRSMVVSPFKSSRCVFMRLSRPAGGLRQSSRSSLHLPCRAKTWPMKRRSRISPNAIRSS
jgi:hypothetical protein